MSIIDTLRERVTAAGTALMIEPLRTAEARDLLAAYDALVDDKRRLAQIADDLSAQNAALNEIMRGMVEAEEWEREMTKPVSAEVWADMKTAIEKIDALAAQNAELLDQLGDAPLTAEAEAEYSEMMHRLNDPNDDEPLTGDYGGAGSERCPECGVYDYAGEYYCPVCGFYDHAGEYYCPVCGGEL